MAVMLVVAGVNGAGKSAKFGRDHKNYIDPDKFVKDFIDKNPYQGEIVAWKSVLHLVNDNIKNKRDFTIETTLSGKSIINQMHRAKANGFEIQLKYVVLESVARHIERVSIRISKGGHPIAEKDIRRRFETSLRNLPKAMAIADKVTIFDNSNRLRPVLKIEKDRVVLESKKLPDHLREKLFTQMKLIIRDDVTKIEFTSRVELNPFSKTSIEDQKKEIVKNFMKRLVPNSGKLSTKFEKLDSKEIKHQRDRSLDRGGFF